MSLGGVVCGEYRCLITSTFLGSIQGLIGLADELFVIMAVFTQLGNAEADVDAQVDITECHWFTFDGVSQAFSQYLATFYAGVR